MRVLIFTHGDADGICAGAIALAANLDAHVLFSSPYSLLEDLSNVRDSDKAIICDVSLPENRLTQLQQRFSEVADRGALTYINHHPLPETVLKEERARRPHSNLLNLGAGILPLPVTARSHAFTDRYLRRHSRLPRSHAADTNPP